MTNPAAKAAQQIAQEAVGRLAERLALRPLGGEWMLCKDMEAIISEAIAEAVRPYVALAEQWKQDVYLLEMFEGKVPTPSATIRKHIAELEALSQPKGGEK